jgi:spore coat polysaccharide biosynthesis protein SpsF
VEPEKRYKTDQEAFWAGPFGDEYIGRNISRELQSSNLAFWARIIGRTTGVTSALELGANVGLNLLALQRLIPEVALAGVEVNQTAADQLREIPGVEAHHGSILEFRPTSTYDLVFTKTVLIHIPPEVLGEVYDLMYDASNRYVCVAEYYNPSPVQVEYRGHSDRLFKRDFAGEMMERHPGLRLVDYGFSYHGDPHFPQDDITWFLMEKGGTES